ncbi:MAG: oligosaccharide flippase family protein [Muribaculaceae bacterium]|nr:oligosaccharide flippase family protein [Muribaculaceae bacterium]
MAGIKSLAKDTAIYGLSSIVGRFLNWCLVPLYTILFTQAEYGVVTFVYAVVALALIILTYGMETGFFRFANHERWSDPMEVYSTALISLFVSSTVFVIGVLCFLSPVSEFMQCSGNESYILLMAVAVAIDAFTAMPFSYLRFRKRPVRFAVLRLVNIGLNIGLNLFFLLLCPFIWKNMPQLIDWFYQPDYAIGYIFLSNAIASVVTLIMLIPELRGFNYRFNSRLWREMMSYSIPLLVLGVAGIMNQTIDKIIFPLLYPDPAQAMAQLGIYGANYKIAIVMVMFTQAFRFAYEPFIFARNKEAGNGRQQSYSDAMKFFIIFSMIIFMGVMFYIDILKYFISPKYFSGLKVVPVIMMAEVFFGVFFNLSLWYKLTDRTIWGMYFSLLGLAVTLGLNALLVPYWGYMGCAWAAFGCYGVMMLASYFVGQKKHPVGYPLKRIGAYVTLAILSYVIGVYVFAGNSAWIDYVLRGLLIVLYVGIVVRFEKIQLPLPAKIRKYIG